MIPLNIAKTSERVVSLIDTTKERWSDSTLIKSIGCISIVGILSQDETVQLQIPAEDPFDVNEDSHWTPLMQDGIAATLTSNNNVLSVPVGIFIRIEKPTTVNQVGVRWS